MKIFLLLLFMPFLVKAQVDTIQAANFKVYYNVMYKCPILVTYILYKGGGACTRTNLHFISGTSSATDKDYSRSGYDQGLLLYLQSVDKY